MAKVKRKQRGGMRAIMPDVEISHLEGTIMSAFFPEAEEMTINEIIKRTYYSYERINTALKSLKSKDIVKEKKVGKTLVYSLNLGSLYSYSLGFNNYMLEREIDFIKKHKKEFKAIKEIIANPYVWGLILFGSYSKDLQTKQSDIDIICIAQNKEEVKRLLGSLRHKYNIKFSPIILPLHEFPDIKKDNPELWNDLKNYGIVFKGDDTFYYWMYKDAYDFIDKCEEIIAK